MSDVSIRPATPDDAAEIQRVARASWHAAHDDIVGSEAVDDAIDEWYDPERLADAAARDEGTFPVALADGDVVGFAQGVPGDGDDPAWLARIYVDPDCWGDGVGTELLARVESWVRGTDADRLRLAVMADNDVGNAFYETHGYEVVAEREAELFGATFEEYVREKEV